MISADLSITVTPMASTTPLVGLDDQENDGRKVEGFYKAPLKRNRTNAPWTPAEEDRLKGMRDAGVGWGDIAKVKARMRCQRKRSDGCFEDLPKKK